MHIHRCDVCQDQVAICADDCQHDGKSYCSMHHTDPKHRVDPTPPVGRTISAASVIVQQLPKSK